ncbi:RdgB/HAM1 family non-canonical purine NTP pyrophosphatase [Liberiplasma polymorphum]|uniref:RdgB/HAM1 family non-canonical purine NTP pyrophosphatase n=1 Tax=Liberiplasma polymorphum TaxID=3374570 RepID=UPI003775238A
MKKIIIATKNKGKLLEYEKILQPLGFEVFSLFDFDLEEIQETGDTFLKNALLKAHAVRKHTTEMVLADDSGLEVAALNNAPGVHSKRYSNEGTDLANNLKMLETMKHEYNRQAKFVTMIVLIDKSGHIESFKGELHGYIHTALEGDEGFGYDPLFIPVGYTKTLAELGFDAKNKISHRARALQKVVDYLAKEY